MLLIAAVVGVSPAWGQVGLNATRSSLLYSADAEPDCSELSKLDDADLPLNVARIRVVGAPVGRPLRYRWSLKKRAKGLLAADLDLGPGGETPAIGAMCSDFGNACILTEGKLNFYNEDHILFVAPTCDVLPDNTRKQFRGGVSRVSVKVTDGRRKLGKASVNIEWGRNGSVTLFVSDMENPPRFRDGLPTPYPVSVFANPIFGWDATEPTPLPPGTMTADFAGGGTASGFSCPFPQFDGCDEVIFPAPGRFIVLLTLKFEEGSALCDNITVRVAECSDDAKLEVIPRPKRDTYDPANPSQANVDLTVRLRNTSKPRGGLPACNFLLQGANVLTCTADLKVGSVTDTKNTRFDLKHCSVTTSQSCLTNGDCSPSVCGDCQPNEVCLNRPHCSKSFDVLCGNDAECEKDSATCPNCQEDETCVRILEIGAGDRIFLRPGESVDLFHQPVTLSNVLSETARLKDTWTANVLIPEISADDTLRYRIRGRPAVGP